jgi:hypothetical protein
MVGTSIIDAVATIWDVIAYAEGKRHPMCGLSLDFSNAFDRIVHEYLFYALRAYGLPEPFVTGIEHMYGGATSSAQVNGQLYEPIPIDCEIRQGCPLSMVLYTLCLHPLLKILERNLTGIKLGRRARPIKVVAYADDVTILVTSVTEFAAVEEALRLYEKATGAIVNPAKSRALAVGGWRAHETVLGIPYQQSVTILGITFWGTIAETKIDTWQRITSKVRCQAKKAYDRDTNLAHRNHLCARMPTLQTMVRCANFAGTQRIHTKTNDCRVMVPMERNHLQGADVHTPTPQTARGMDLIDIPAKRRALLLSCLYN